MKSKILWLRISYWAGAILDGLVALHMLFPQILATRYNLSNFNPSIEYKTALGIGASLMLGWTFLLIWADRKPVERKGVLLVTIFPALCGLVITEIYAVANGFVRFENMLSTWMVQAMLFVLFTYSYLKARKTSDTALKL